MSDNQNIVQFEDVKNPKKKVNKGKVILIILGCVLGILLVLALVFHTRKITVTGNTYYSDDECKASIKKNVSSSNVLLFYLQNKFLSTKKLPFVKRLEVSITAPGKMTVSVKEKTRAGCILYNERYIYFDREGYALESSTNRYSDIPMVTGLTYKEIVLNEKIPEKNQKIFQQILRVTIAIDKYQLKIDQIHFDAKKHMFLIHDDLTIDLYDETNLDMKLSELSSALGSMKGKKGTISMEFFTTDDPLMIFKAKKS